MACRALEVLALALDRDDVIPTFAQALSDPEDAVRKLAVGALAEFGSKARTALPRLEEVMSHDPSWLMRWYASYAIDRINFNPSVRIATSAEGSWLGWPKSQSA